MKIYLSFIVAVSKMFFRRKQSIFWSLFFPIVTMLVFGNLKIVGYSAPNVGLLNSSNKAESTVQKLEDSTVINIVIIESSNEASRKLNITSSIINGICNTKCSTTNCIIY